MKIATALAGTAVAGAVFVYSIGGASAATTTKAPAACQRALTDADHLLTIAGEEHSTWTAFARAS